MDKKEQIYQAALTLFVQVGFDKTPTSRISQAAGVATGTLFHHFPTKEALINSLYLRCKDGILLNMAEGIASNGSLKARLRLIFDNLVQWATNAPAEYAFFQQYSHSAVILTQTRAEGMQKFEPFLNMIRKGIKQEKLKPLPEDYLFTILSELFMQNAAYFIENPSRVEDKAFMNHAFQLLWDAVRA